jgi:hypothetical protein
MKSCCQVEEKGKSTARKVLNYIVYAILIFLLLGITAQLLLHHWVS